MQVKPEYCPCKGCNNRTLGCHDNCDGYEAYKKRREEINNARRQQSYDESAYISRIAHRKSR